MRQKGRIGGNKGRKVNHGKKSKEMEGGSEEKIEEKEKSKIGIKESRK